MNKMKTIEAQLTAAVDLAKKPLAVLEKQCQETKGKVAGTVEDAIPDFHAAAVHAKAEATWQAMDLANQHHLTPLLSEAMQLINRTFAGRMISALDITDLINMFAHQAHNEVLQFGWSLENISKKFGCTPEVQAELYSLAMPHGTDTALAGIMSEVAQKIAKGDFPNTESLVVFLLEKLATFYAAKHVVQNYEASSSSTAEA